MSPRKEEISSVICRNGKVIAVGEDAPEELKPQPGEEVTLEELIQAAREREGRLVRELEGENG